MDAGEVAQVIQGLAAVLDEPLPPEVLTEVGQAAVTMILLRTKQGIDADLKAFVPYSKPYAKVREKKHLQSAPVDLARTGQMLGSITPAVTGPDEITIAAIGQHDADKLLWVNEGTKRMPQRELLDIRHPREIDALEEMIAEARAATIEGRLP